MDTFRDHLILEYEVPKYEGDLGAPNLFSPLADHLARRKIDLILQSSHVRRKCPSAAEPVPARLEVDSPDGKGPRMWRW